MSVDTFTLFVLLPDDSVCTLRNLVSGINIEDVKARLELAAGLPSHIYILLYPDGERLVDHQKLLTQENIKDGYVLRIHVLEHWETLYNSVSKNNIENVYHNGGVHLKGNLMINAEESGKLESAVYDRRCVALYMASYLGLLRMCNMLISVGVDINGITQFGRTALHAASAKENATILKYLIDYGAKIYITDLFGKTALDVAQKFSSNMCEKNLKIMQLNLRGQNSRTKHTKVKYTTSSLSDIKFDKVKETGQRPKSLVESGNTMKEVVTKSRPQTHFVSRQIQAKGNKTSIAWISIQDSEGKRNQNYKPQTFNKFQNIKRMETLEEDVITCKPLPLLRKKSCLKFATDTDGKAISRSTQTTPVASKLDVSTTPMLFAPPSSRLNGDDDFVTDDMNTSFSIDEREASARTRSSKSSKIVSFSRKDRPVYPDISESSRVMKKRINMIANRRTQKRSSDRETSTPQRSGVIHDRWADQRKSCNIDVRAEISSSDNDSDDVIDGFDEDDSGNESDANAEAFDAWVKRKQLESKRMPRKITRPIHDIIKIGSTVVGDGRNPPAEYNLTAYKNWLERRRQNRRIPNFERIKSMRDFMSQKKVLEEKRQKLLLNAISYDEWMDHEFDRKTLIRKILKADFDQLKKMELEKNKSSSTKQTTKDNLQSEFVKKEELERKQRELQQNYRDEKEKWRQQIMRHEANSANNDWLRKQTSQQPRMLMRSNSKGNSGNDVKRAVEASRAYKEWLKRKNAEDANIQNQIQTEKDVINAYREQRTAQVLTC